jgi:hypothetical protein
MAFANHYLATGGDSAKEYVTTVLYDSRLPSESVIKNDLEYVANNWRGIGFDLWEEVRRLSSVHGCMLMERKLRSTECISLP